MKQFHKSLFEALQSGNFNADTLAENDPDSIKEIAEAAGIDLANALSEFEESAPQMNGAFPPRRREIKAIMAHHLRHLRMLCLHRLTRMRTLLIVELSF